MKAWTCYAITCRQKSGKEQCVSRLVCQLENDHALGPLANTCLTWRFFGKPGVDWSSVQSGASWGRTKDNDNGRQRLHKDAFLVRHVIIPSPRPSRLTDTEAARPDANHGFSTE